MVDLGYKLYDVLTTDTTVKLHPEAFINDYRYENGTLIFETVGSTVAVPRKTKIYIPFTKSGDLIPEFKNGVYEAYPTYNILVLTAQSLHDLNSLSICGAYDMSSSLYEEIYLNDNLERVAITRIQDDDAIIKRYEPHLNLLPNMQRFYDSVKSGAVSLNI